MGFTLVDENTWQFSADTLADFALLFEQAAQKLNALKNSVPSYKETSTHNIVLELHRVKYLLAGEVISEARLAKDLIQQAPCHTSCYQLIRAIADLQLHQDSALEGGDEYVFGEHLGYELAMYRPAYIPLYSDLILGQDLNHVVFQYGHVWDIQDKYGMTNDVLHLLGVTIANDGQDIESLLEPIKDKIIHAQSISFEQGQFFKTLLEQELSFHDLKNLKAPSAKGFDASGLELRLSILFKDPTRLNSLIIRAKQIRFEQYIRIQKEAYSKKINPHCLEITMLDDDQQDWYFHAEQEQDFIPLFEQATNKLQQIALQNKEHNKLIDEKSLLDINQTLFFLQGKYLSEDRLGLIVSNTPALKSAVKYFLKTMIIFTNAHHCNLFQHKQPLGDSLAYWLARDNKESLNLYMGLLAQTGLDSQAEKYEQFTDLMNRYPKPQTLHLLSIALGNSSEHIDDLLDKYKELIEPETKNIKKFKKSQFFKSLYQTVIPMPIKFNDDMPDFDTDNYEVYYLQDVLIKLFNGNGDLANDLTNYACDIQRKKYYSTQIIKLLKSLNPFSKATALWN